jgi:hypothetical protein
MGTTFSEVYDNFMTLIKDFRIASLYTTSESNFETYLSGFLISAIEDFSVCNQSLANSSGTFTETLVQENISLLAKLMKKRWLEKEIADVTQMSLHISDKAEFKTYSEAQNLREKETVYNFEREEISQLLVGYSLRNRVDWSAWYSGVFFTP